MRQNHAYYKFDSGAASVSLAGKQDELHTDGFVAVLCDHDNCFIYMKKSCGLCFSQMLWFSLMKF